MMRFVWKKDALFCASVFFLSAGIFGAHGEQTSDGQISSDSQLLPQSGLEINIEKDSSAVKPTAIALPERKKRTFFSFVDSELLALVENGSPSSLRKADGLIRAMADKDEDEDVLLFVADSIMSLCWKSEGFSAEYPSVPPSNSYVGTVNSARRGSYDRLSGEADFLSLVLPSLVLVSPSSSSAQGDFFQSASAALEKASALRGDSVLLNYLWGLLCFRLGDFVAAEAHLFSAKSAYENNSYEIDFALVQSYMENKKYVESYGIAKRLYEERPASRLLLKICAESSFYAGDIDACESFVAKVLQQEPENTEYILLRAKVLVMKKEYIRASSLLDAYARTDTESKDYLLLRAKIQKEWNKNARLAADTMENAFALYPDDGDVVMLAAEIASEAARNIGGKSAEELSALVLEKDPLSVSALKIKVKELVKKERWVDAYRTSSEIMARGGVDDELLFMHISVCLSAGKKEEAWKLASQLYAERRDDEDVVQAYVLVLVSTGRGAEATRLISSLIPKSSQKLKSFLYYQKSLLSSGEEAVMADLRSSLTANPRNRDALFRLYQIYFGKKEYRKAQYYLKQVVAISPDDEKIRALDEQLKSLLSK
ncbi:MAG: tetratricopeptide repeat protein [Treponema sp.]|nr:tetratricopeptide repeat protein [Treponema sp.]